LSWQENLIFIPHRSNGVPNVVFHISISTIRKTRDKFLL
jgi:hypothetical protein